MFRWTALVAVAASVLVGAASAFAYPVPGASLGPADVTTRQAAFDEQFIDTMAMHHMSAIEMAQIALRRAQHPQVRRIARQIIRSQANELREFHALRRRWYGSASFRMWPTDAFKLRMMGEEPMPEMLRRLRHGRPFDRLFLNAMIAHHSGANAMARWELLRGSHWQLRQIAENIINAQSREIGQMIRLRVHWYGRNAF